MILTPPPTGGQQILRHALGRRWRTIAAGTVVGMLLGVGAAFVIPVTHSATVSMTVTPPTRSPVSCTAFCHGRSPRLVCRRLA